MTGRGRTRKCVGGAGTHIRAGERFFDTWSPQMAWCLGVVYECGAADPEEGLVIESSDRRLLGAFRKLVRESKLLRDTRTLVAESPHMGERLCSLGMVKGAFTVRRVPLVPEEYVRYLVQGILDTHAEVASYDPYLAELRLELATRQRACLSFLERELRKRGYGVSRGPVEIDFHGVARGEPASYVYSLSMCRPREIADFYNWLFGKPRADLPYDGAQRWMWSQLRLLLRDIDALSELVKDKEMMAELRRIAHAGEREGLADGWLGRGHRGWYHLC
ncbi:MAG: hypothetical protein QXU73_00715 [Thermoplasmata archaeon]